MLSILGGDLFLCTTLTRVHINGDMPCCPSEQYSRQARNLPLVVMLPFDASWKSLPDPFPPSYLHHSRDTLLPLVKCTCVRERAPEYTFVSVMKRRSAKFRLTSVAPSGYWQNGDEDETEMCWQQRESLLWALLCTESSQEGQIMILIFVKIICLLYIGLHPQNFFYCFKTATIVCFALLLKKLQKSCQKFVFSLVTAVCRRQKSHISKKREILIKDEIISH